MRLHAELALHAIDQHLEVQLAHAADQRLPGLLVDPHAEGRVFLGQALQRVGQLVLVGLGLRLDRHRDDRLGELDRFEHDRRARVAQRLAREGLLDADDRADVARPDLGHVFALLGVDLHEPADALLAVLARSSSSVCPVCSTPE